MDPKKMLILSLIIAIALFGCVATKQAVVEKSYEGEVDPMEFDTKWQQVQKKLCNAGGRRHAHIWIKNPDPKHPVQIVEIIIFPPSLMVGYSYKLDGTLHHFKYTDGTFKEFFVPPAPKPVPKQVI
jgi:hypothetical protein